MQIDVSKLRAGCHAPEQARVAEALAALCQHDAGG